MDESFMSTSSFDEDSFLCEAFQDSDPKNSNSLNSSKDMSTNSIDISGLLSQPFPTSKLEFNDLETPRNSGFQANRPRKRKNFAPRCLSSDLNDFLPVSDSHQPSFQEFRQSKNPSELLFPFKKPNILSSIENKLSPTRSTNIEKSSIELTPEFDTTNKSAKYTENKVMPRVPLKATNRSSGVPFQKYFSENHGLIMCAIQKSAKDPSLIGDFSKPYVLPLLTNSKHQDLKSISCHELAKVLQGKYNNIIGSFTVIDCRYPYEFEGGHIQTAINLYTQEHILSNFLTSHSKDSLDSSDNQLKRRILIFHCEFSSERGPSLCRFLRNKDRVKNSENYPALNYPELYLLEGGYKEFYTFYQNLCNPSAYVPMHAKEHEDDLRKFRTLVKSHSFDSKFSTHKRNLRL